MRVLKVFRSVLSSPKKFFKSDKSGWKDIAKYVFILSLIFGIIGSLIKNSEMLVLAFNFPGLPLAAIIITAVVSAIVWAVRNLFAAALYSVIVYAAVRSLGSNKKFTESVRCVGYSFSPAMLFTLLGVPILSVFISSGKVLAGNLVFGEAVRNVGFIWTLAVLFAGIRERHKLTTLKSLVPVAVVLIIRIMTEVYLGLL